MTRYVVGYDDDALGIVVLGIVEAPDIGAATLAAQPRFPEAGCFPWDDATAAQREQALLRMNGDLRAGWVSKYDPLLNAYVR